MAESGQRNDEHLMGRLVTIDEYLNSLSERVIDNTRQLKRDTRQRRNGMEDLYGICFSANGDANYPARFYVSLSPDYVYLEQFAFKFVIKPYTSSVAGVDSGSISIGETELSVGGDGEYVADGTSTLSGSVGEIDPNPHTHETSGSIGGLTYGIKKINTSSTHWEVWIGGVNITDYLRVQHSDYDNHWLGEKGMNVYPNNELGHPEDFYDILEVCDLLTDEGEIEKREKILEPKFLEVEVKSDAPFGLDAYLYLKYPHTNR